MSTRRDVTDGLILGAALACVLVGVVLISAMWLGTPDPALIGLVPK